MPKEMVYVRYTGTRPGSMNYTIPGRSRKVPFGMNPDHVQQRLTVDEYNALKKTNPKDFIIVPDDLMNYELGLHDRISQFPGIDQETRDRLVNVGLTTVGQVMALGEVGLTRIFVKKEKVDEILDALYEAHFGYSITKKDKEADRFDDLTLLSRVGSATQKALNDLGIRTYAQVAKELTLEQWLSLPGKTEESYRIVVEGAKGFLKE